MATSKVDLLKRYLLALVVAAVPYFLQIPMRGVICIGYMDI